METVKIRLNVLPPVLTRLFNGLVNLDGSPDPCQRYVQIRRAEFDGTTFEIDLNIRHEYDEIGPRGGKCVTVTREMVGELFDLLGIFPRTNQDDGEHSKILAEIRQNLGAIWSQSGSPTAPWLRQPLKRIEELLMSLEKV